MTGEERHWAIPVELFLFQIGETNFYAYTQAENPITFSARTYAPLAISRDTFTSSGTLDKTRMKVVVPLDSEIAELFRLTSPGFNVSLRIFAGDLAAPQKGFSLIWLGRVIQSSREDASGSGEQCALSCEPASTTMRQNGLRANWQLPCRHVLYSPRCGASEVAATTSRVASAVGANWIDVPSGWQGARTFQNFVSGKVTWVGPFGTEQRRILSATATRLTVSGTTTGLVAGATVGIVLGCNRQMTDCLNLHNRIQSFGGFPFIPKENPINKVQV